MNVVTHMTAETDATSAAENPYASPKSLESPASATASLKVATRLFYWMGVFGLAYNFVFVPVAIVIGVTKDGPEFAPIVGATIWCAVNCVLFRWMMTTAKDLGKDFDATYRRARWLGIVAGTLYFPILTVPAILAIRHLESCRQALVGEPELVSDGRL